MTSSWHHHEIQAAERLICWLLRKWHHNPQFLCSLRPHFSYTLTVQVELV